MYDILFVDDDPKILSAYRRNLRNRFNIHTAESGADGLALLKKINFPVVVADMTMPEMNGIEFLKAAQEIRPDTVLIMLTGNADQKTAQDAVNEGHVFRFLTKPCSLDEFSNTLDLGLKHYEIDAAEQELLEKTLTGSIKMLVEVLTLTNPEAFSRASRLREIAKFLSTALKLRNPWRFEVAAMLSQTGCLTLSAELMLKKMIGEPLSESEIEMFAKHPATAAGLIRNIPRLEDVAMMIRDQRKPLRSFPAPSEMRGKLDQAIGAQILKAAIDYDELRIKNFTHHSAIRRMQERVAEYNPKILAALELYHGNDAEAEDEIRALEIDALKPGMFLKENIVKSLDGAVVVAKGQEISLLMMQRLKNMDQKFGIKQPIIVTTNSRTFYQSGLTRLD